MSLLAGPVSWGNRSRDDRSKALKKPPAVLDKKGTVPAGMARVIGGEVKGIGKLEDFYMDRFEVTNSDTGEFIQKGGYQKKEYWKNAFAKEGKTLTWEQAEAVVDRPACRSCWLASRGLCGGRGRLPGIRDQLASKPPPCRAMRARPPGRYHWGVAHGRLTPMNLNLSFYEFIIPQSNFKGKGPERVERSGDHRLRAVRRGRKRAGMVLERNAKWKLDPGRRLGRCLLHVCQLQPTSPFDRSLKTTSTAAIYLHPKGPQKLGPRAL